MEKEDRAIVDVILVVGWCTAALCFGYAADSAGPGALQVVLWIVTAGCVGKFLMRLMGRK